MDIQLEQRKGLKKKHVPYIAGGALFVLLVLWLIFGNHEATFKVEARTLSIEKVTKEMFNDFVRVNGQVQPITTIQLSPLEGGIVEERLAEEGAAVKKGDVIIRLSNSNLDLSILDSEAQLAEKQNFLRNTQVTMEQDKLTNRTEKLQLDLDVKRKYRAYQQQEELYKEKLTAKEDYLQAKEDYELAREKRELMIERLRQDSIYRTVQMEQMEESLSNMRRNMVMIRQRVENLHVKSPIDGELGLLDVVLGQNVTMGQKIGQINDLSDFKIEAQIDEHYIDRIKTGLPATFERQSASYQLKVRKVYPEVREGKFKTDLVFVGKRPGNIRTGQTYYINLELGQPTEAILIPRGSFFQTTGGKWIFVLDPSGKKAYRRNIRIGRQNPQHYEVLDGLEAGEKVIVSNYEAFKENDILVLE